MLAARHGIPFIVVAPISTVDLDVADGSGYGSIPLDRIIKLKQIGLEYRLNSVRHLKLVLSGALFILAQETIRLL